MEIGDRFSRLIYIEDLGMKNTGIQGRRKRYGNFQCDCGNTKEIRLESVKYGHTHSCGCFNIESATIHGLHKHHLTVHRGAMIQRCTNKNHKHYKHYGGRGIKICDEWRDDFMSFYNWSIENGWKEGLELDRIDNDGDYEPFNCQWITHKENNHPWKKRAIENTASGYVGIVFHNKTKTWHATLRNEGKLESLKYYKTIEEAVEVRLKREIEVFGEQKSNFHYNKEN